MSTILDALRKVERERDSSSEAALEAPHVTAEVRRRRRFPWVPILVCAVVGFGGGAILSWLMPAEQEIEVAALPVAPPPPAIPVPREPVRMRPVPPPAPVTDTQPETTGDVAVAPAAPAPPAVAPGAPPAAAPAAPAVVAAVPKGPAPAAVAPPPAGTVPANPADVVAAAAKQGSALEPSPFTPPRELERDAAPAAANPPPKVAAVPSVPTVPKLAPPPAEPAHDADVAAIAPAVPPAPGEALNDAGQPPEAEPEPEAPAETLVDTGRSPPGNPKVALSFLQWSADPARRFAFISIDGAPSQRVHEGETAGGLTVSAITKNGVQFKRENVSFIIRPRH